jgi:hypothetical protein
MFLNRFLDIGFKEVIIRETELGIVGEYKYSPEYLNKNHYILIVFNYNSNVYKPEDAEYGLYIHDENGVYIKTLHIMMHHDKGKLLQTHFNNIFKLELRDSILNKLGI